MNFNALTVFIVAAHAAVLSAQAATLAVSPSLITNDFSGRITLTIGGLPSAGQTVRLDKYYDLATNGVVDAEDPLMQSFLIKDGTLPLIGGATNLNVPFDTDATANGQIVATLSQPGLEKLFGLLEGPFLFRVSSPSNTFAVVFDQLSMNAACICATAGPSSLNMESRQCRGDWALPSQMSASPAPPVNPTLPSTMSSLR